MLFWRKKSTTTWSIIQDKRVWKYSSIVFFCRKTEQINPCCCCWKGLHVSYRKVIKISFFCLPFPTNEEKSPSSFCSLCVSGFRENYVECWAYCILQKYIQSVIETDVWKVQITVGNPSTSFLYVLSSSSRTWKCTWNVVWDIVFSCGAGIKGVL